jgi:hypothetical protein
VVLVNSTSVYKNSNKALFESDSEELVESPLMTIEDVLGSWGKFKTTIVRFGG